ncbi:MAG: FliM/FliN family flagellar motor switch protein, partial [Natronospirillum sp.]
GVQSDVDEIDERWVLSLQKDIMNASVAVTAQVAQRKIALRELIDIKPGDIIPIELPETTVMSANGVPVFETSLGRSRDQLALKIRRPITRGRSVDEEDASIASAVLASRKAQMERFQRDDGGTNKGVVNTSQRQKDNTKK